jgi:hypothetical protein
VGPAGVVRHVELLGQREEAEGVLMPEHRHFIADDIAVA